MWSDGIWFWLFQGSMKKILKRHYESGFVKDVMKRSKRVYRELVEQADEIGSDNPMRFNEISILVMTAPYVAGNKSIPVEVIGELAEECILRYRRFFVLNDYNNEKTKRQEMKEREQYIAWYNAERQKKYPTSFLVDFEGKPNERACYYRITRCPIHSYFQKMDLMEVLTVFCDLDPLMVTLQHGTLCRKHTLSRGGEYCDILMKGDREA